MGQGKPSPYPGIPLTSANEVLHGQPDVPGNLAQERRSDVASLVEWDGCASTVRVTVLHVRPALADRGKAEPFKETADLRGFEHRHGSHA
jgi:hypothetical protein